MKLLVFVLIIYIVSPSKPPPSLWRRFSLNYKIIIDKCWYPIVPFLMLIYWRRGNCVFWQVNPWYIVIKTLVGPKNKTIMKRYMYLWNFFMLVKKFFIGWFYGMPTLDGLLYVEVSLRIIVPNYIAYKNMRRMNWLFSFLEVFVFIPKLTTQRIGTTQTKENSHVNI